MSTDPENTSADSGKNYVPVEEHELDPETDRNVSQGEIVILGAEECPNCGAVQLLFEEEFGEGYVRYVDIESEEGKKIDKLFGNITAVPFVAYHDREKKRFTECELIPEGETMEDAVWTIVCDIASDEKSRAEEAE